MVNEIELSEKFNQIFVDKETVNYFHTWNAKKNKKGLRGTYFMPFVVSLFCLSSLIYITYRLNRTTVIQEVYKRYDGEHVFATWVYYRGELIEGYTVPISQLNDSIKRNNKEAGEALLKTLNQ